jgi:hypothetical protein
MRQKYLWIVAIALVAVGGGLIGLNLRDPDGAYREPPEEERELTVDGLPPRVQAEVRRLSAGGLIDEIKEERQGAEVKYEVEIIRGEKKLEYEFAADGSLLEQKTKKR